MDITIEGFHSWMWKGLSFLLPFLYIGYGFQFYNAFVLYFLSFHEEATWQVRKKSLFFSLIQLNKKCTFLLKVPVLSALFFMLFLGNAITTSMVIPQKLKERTKLKYRYKSNRHNDREEDKSD
jgi:NADH:ubiquinone oxidoreductase subunit 5 (subunit L)/multisubunit Na+/H+ antiporter MnhA subunit